MRYLVTIHTGINTCHFNGSTDTRADLADLLDQLYRQFPRASGYEYTVTCEVTVNYTLIDSETLPTGEATASKLWEFVQTYKKESR